jgi:hypothetical protein
MADSGFSDTRYHEKTLENSNFKVKFLFLVKKNHQIFTSNPVILHLLNIFEESKSLASKATSFAVGLKSLEVMRVGNRPHNSTLHCKT